MGRKEADKLVGSRMVIKNHNGENSETAWITRFEQETLCYKVFVPGKGVLLYSQANLMKCIMSGEVEIEPAEEIKQEKPLRDFENRFVGVQVVGEDDEVEDMLVLQQQEDAVNAAGRAGRRRSRKNKLPALNLGEVVWYLPFDDAYEIVYANELHEHLNEQELVDRMIRTLNIMRTIREWEAQQKEEEEEEEEQQKQPTEEDEEEEVHQSFRGKERRRVIDVDEATPMLPLDQQPIELDQDEDDEDDVIPLMEAIDEPEQPHLTGSMLDIEAARARAASTGLLSALAEKLEPDSPEYEFVEASSSKSASSVLPLVLTPLEKDMSKPFYLIEQNVVPPIIEPLETRSTAYGFVRKALLKLLELEEAKPHRTDMHKSILSNTDIKERAALERFLASGGLKVVNDVLKAFFTPQDPAETTDAEGVLYILKLLAMIPLPNYTDAAESSIGKTIGLVIKSENQVPFCAIALAKWIRKRWIKDIPKPKSATATNTARGGPTNMMARRQQPFNRPVGSNGLRNGNTNSNANRSKRTKETTPIGPASSPRYLPKVNVADWTMTPAQRRAMELEHKQDHEPIPRVQKRTPQSSTSSTSIDLTSSSSSILSSRLDSSTTRSESGSHASQSVYRTNLKPDYIRRKEVLSRSRLIIRTDKDAETQHYRRQQELQRNRIAALRAQGANGVALNGSSDNRNNQRNSGASSSATFAASGARNGRVSTLAAFVDREEDDAGERGVYGRPQKLSFGSMNVAEFFRNNPPTSIIRPTLPGQKPQSAMARRFAASAAAAAAAHGGGHRRVQLKSILRQQSRYPDAPSSF